MEYDLLLSELFLILKKIISLVKNFIKQIYNKAIIFQVKNKEIFRKLLWDLKCCYDVASDKLLKHILIFFIDNMIITFDITTLELIKGDKKYLYERLTFTNEQDYF